MSLLLRKVDLFDFADEPVSSRVAAHHLHLVRKHSPVSADLRADPHTAGRRVFDICFALAGLTFTFPLMCAVAAAIKATSPGPVFLRQKRLTLHGREFTLLKFRTMNADAEAESGAVLAVEQDPRVTAVGRFLRKTRIDEIPQLWNVLLGEMTIVGPRPERPEIAAMMSRFMRQFSRRLQVKAGITGLAQIENGYVSCVQSYRRKLALDLLYIRKRSPMLDLAIMSRTVGVVLLGKGAR